MNQSATTGEWVFEPICKPNDFVLRGRKLKIIRPKITSVHKVDGGFLSHWTISGGTPHVTVNTTTTTTALYKKQKIQKEEPKLLRKVAVVVPIVSADQLTHRHIPVTTREAVHQPATTATSIKHQNLYKEMFQTLMGIEELERIDQTYEQSISNRRTARKPNTIAELLN